MNYKVKDITVVKKNTGEIVNIRIERNNGVVNIVEPTTPHKHYSCGYDNDLSMCPGCYAHWIADGNTPKEVILSEQESAFV